MTRLAGRRYHKGGTAAHSFTTMRYNKKVIAVLFIVLLLAFILFSSTGNRFFPRRPTSSEQAYDELVLKQSPKDVPVIIVDQHQEVIPYWYKAMKEGLISRERNTVVHFDAHSDMAPPSSPRGIKNFKFHKSYSERHFLPLMESNDRFLYSAIMEGLIGRVIWVKPDWLSNNRTEVRRGYVGTMMHRGTQVFCHCEQFVHGKKRYPMVCGYDEDMKFTKVLQERCRKHKTYCFIETTESEFIDAIQITNRVSLFVDIDEDFFGVESGVEHLIREGISLKTQKVLDVLLPSLYSPDSNGENEVQLDKLMRVLFSQLAIVVKQARDPKLADRGGELTDAESIRTKISNEIISTTKKYFRDKDGVPEFAIFLSSLSVKELRSLARTKYCLISSSRLVGNDDERQFSVCHGNIFPDDKLNEFHVSTKDAIHKRGKLLEEILHYIHKSSAPKFFTVSRSLRDGYTPRDQQQYIERMVLGSVGRAIQTSGNRRRIVYDSHLSFGKEGWKEEGMMKY